MNSEPTGSAAWPPWGHALASFALGISLTGVLALMASRDASARERERFERLAEGHAGWIDGQVELHRTALLRIADHLAFHPTATTRNWSEVIARLDLPDTLPAFREIGYAQPHHGIWQPQKFPSLPVPTPLPCPSTNSPDCREWAVVFASRAHPGSRLSIGNELASTPRIRTWLDSALRGVPVITGPHALSDGTRGLTLIQPLITGRHPDGRPAVQGVVFGSFDFDVFLAHSLDWAAREVAVEVFDSPDLQADTRWNNSTPASLAGPAGWKPRLQASFRRNRFDDIAYVRVTTTPLFDRASLRLRSLFIASTGFLLSSAISGIVFVQTLGRRRAEALSAELAESRELLRHESSRRERLGRDIHDETLQDLYVTGLHLGRLRQHLKDRPSVVSELDQSRSALESVMRRLRAFLVAIDPSPAGSEDLATSLCRLVEQAQRGTTARITLEPSSPLDIPLHPETNLEILHFVREATCNALRHASPSAVVVSLRKSRDCITATVTDDGRGFDPEAASQSGGYGLAQLQRRAASLHGELEIHSLPGGPTRLTLSIPIPKP